jgi:hypothetical protein
LALSLARLDTAMLTADRVKGRARPDFGENARQEIKGMKIPAILYKNYRRRHWMAGSFFDGLALSCLVCKRDVYDL